VRKAQQDAGARGRPRKSTAGQAPRARPASPRREAAGPPFGALLHSLAQRLHQELERALGPLRLSPPHYFVLFALSRYGPRSQLSLGGCAAINRTTMVSLVDHLERLGLARRRPDPEDRRAYVIHLTEKGSAVLDRAAALHREAEARCLRPLSEEEQQLLRDMLARLAPPPEAPGTEPGRGEGRPGSGDPPTR
jgi:DNA-binding MarR family transcriptional regulator